MAQARIYVANIGDGLIEADETNADEYQANADNYLANMAEVDAEIRELISEIPASTSVITGHDSFGYLLECLRRQLFPALTGLSTEVEPSGASMAAHNARTYPCSMKT